MRKLEHKGIKKKNEKKTTINWFTIIENHLPLGGSVVEWFMLSSVWIIS